MAPEIHGTCPARFAAVRDMNRMSPGTTGDTRGARIVGALYGAL